MIEINETVAYVYGAFFTVLAIGLIILAEIELGAKKRKGQNGKDNG